MIKKKIKDLTLKEDLSKSYYLNDNYIHKEAPDYFAYADNNGEVRITTDKTKKMSYNEIRKRVLRAR